MEARYGHFVCSFWCLMEGNKTNKRQNKISFLRFGDLYNVTKRTNDKTKWPQNLILSSCRSVVLAPCGSWQNKQTTKRTSYHDRSNFAVTLLFCRSDVLWGRRQNEPTKKWNSISSFWQIVQRDKTNKWWNEILFWHSVVCSFSRWSSRKNKQTKKWNSISSLGRLVQRDKTNKWWNEILFWRSVICSFSRWSSRKNKQTKKWNSISSFWRLVQRDKMNKWRNEILFSRSVVCSC